MTWSAYVNTNIFQDVPGKKQQPRLLFTFYMHSFPVQKPESVQRSGSYNHFAFISLQNREPVLDFLIA